MTQDEFLELERLLDKLRSELGYRFSITGGVHEMYTIGIYKSDTGDYIKHETSLTIQETVSKLKEK